MNVLEKIDNFLNFITMYRLVLYYLIVLVIIAFIFALFGLMPFSALSLLLSAEFIVVVCWLVNEIFAMIFSAPTNVESVFISALILVLILDPAKNISEVPVLFWASILTMASKYIFAFHKKHFFNPVVVGVVLISFGLNVAASWWIGTALLAPFVIIGGALLIRKMRRARLVAAFFVFAIATIFGLTLLSGGNVMTTVKTVALDSPLFFLAFVMLTEPLTTPPTQKLQMIYGALVGFLFAPQIHIAQFYSTPEVALGIGNIFSYFVSPKFKLMLQLKNQVKYGDDVVDFQFERPKNFVFNPGQYMEWTLPHRRSDDRGNRRYFTIASSPSEDMIHLGVKFYPKGSSYKKAMSQMNENTLIVGAQLSGDFTLPENPQQKCVFIAGGIGVTPFRSMLKHLLDKNEPRPIILFYANKEAKEIAYSDVFSQAETQLGIKVVYTLTDLETVPKDWKGKVGRINDAMIKEEVPDFAERFFYLSGPHAMVEAYESVLLGMGVQRQRIKKDYFPGFV